MKNQEGATVPNEKRKLSESLRGASDQPEKSRKINPQEMMENDMEPTGKNTLVADLSRALQNKETIKILSQTIVFPILARFEEKVNGLTKELSAKVSIINELQNEITTLKEKMFEMEDKIEKSGKEKNLLLDGIKESENENTKENALGFIKDNLKIDVKDYQVNEIYRIGRKESDKPRRILIKFLSQNMKDKIYNERLQLIKSSNPSLKSIYINEDLTKKNQNILFHARNLKKSKRISSVWTRNGNVTIKVDGQESPCIIKNVAELEKYRDALNITLDGSINTTKLSGPRTSSAEDMDQMINSVLNFTYSEETLPPKDKRNQDNKSQFVDPGNKGQTTIQANQSQTATSSDPEVITDNK